MTIILNKKRETPVISNLINLGIPKDTIGKSIKNFYVFYSTSIANKLKNGDGDKHITRQKEIKKWFVNYLRDIEKTKKEGRGYFLHGPNSVGKTFLGSICLQEFYKNRYTVRRSTMIEYLDIHTSVWNAAKGDKEIISDNLTKKYKAVDYLLLDDVGKEYDTKLSSTVLDELLRFRMEKGLITSIITNLSTELFFERYGPSVEASIKFIMTPLMLLGRDYVDYKNKVYQKQKIYYYRAANKRVMFKNMVGNLENEKR